MNTQRGLLPWVVGGLATAALAIGLTALSVNRTAASISPPRPVLAEQAAPVQAPIAKSAQVPSDPPAAPPAAPPAERPQPQQQQEVTAGQIWQCTTNGVKTFSNNPCGEKSSRVQVGPINTMRPPPVSALPRAYPPVRYAPAYNDSSNNGEQDAYPDQDAEDTGQNSYTIVQGIRVVKRRTSHHPHRPIYHHKSSATPRKN